MPETKSPTDRLIMVERCLKTITGRKVKDITKDVNIILENNGIKPVTERTIRNDFEEIRNHGISIISKNGKFRYEDIDDSINKFQINDEERNVLDIALQALSILKGTPFLKQFNEISNRILGSAYLKEIDNDHVNYIQIGDGGFDTGAKWLHTIYNAIIEKKALSIGYRPFEGELKTRTISPYLLKEYRNKWYMVAHARELKSEEKTNVFKLFRIESIEETKEPYIYDEHFNAASYFKFSLGVFHSHKNQPQLIRLKFIPQISKLIKESPLHPSMKIEKEDETGLTVNIYVYNTPELKNMIMSFGSDCTVISPEDLKNNIHLDLKKCFENYSL